MSPLACAAANSGRDHAHFIELLGRFAAVLEHGAHGGVCVYVGIFTLHVGIGRFGKRDIFERLEDAAVHVAHAIALGAVEDVGLRRLAEAFVDQGLLHKVLHAFNRRHALHGPALYAGHHVFGHLPGNGARPHGAGCLECLVHRFDDLLDFEIGGASVAFDDGFDHGLPLSPRRAHDAGAHARTTPFVQLALLRMCIALRLPRAKPSEFDRLLPRAQTLRFACAARSKRRADRGRTPHSKSWNRLTRPSLIEIRIHNI